MKIEKNYRKSLLIAVIFHVALLCFLVFNFAPSVFRAPPSSAPMQTIQAKAISESAVHEEVQKINEQRAAVAHEKVVQQEKIAEQKEAAQKVKEAQVAHEVLVQKEKAAAVVAAKQALILKENQAAALKIQEAKAAEAKATEKKLAAEKAQKLKQKKLAQQKVTAQKAAAQKAAAQKAAAQKAAKANKLLAEQKKLQQEMIQQQINSEAKNISQIQTQAQQQGEINKYKAEILALIQSNWRIDQVNDKLKCIYDVSVAPDGTILSIVLKQSSGNSNLDESARQAIEASSPLPVPQKLALFNHFRQLVLTLSPQGILQSVGTA